MKKQNQSIFNSLENFVQYAAKYKLWAFASTVFIASFWFAVGTFNETPGQLAKLERNLSNLEIMVADGVRAANVSSAILNAIYQINMTGVAYGNLVETIDTHQVSHPEELDLALQITIESRRQLAIDIGRIKGSKFHAPLLSGYTNDITKNLKDWDWILYKKQIFLVESAAGHWELAQQHANILNGIAPRNYEYHEELEALFVSFIEQVQALLNEFQTSYEEINADLLFLKIKLAFAVLALGYEGIFLFVALLEWRRRHLAHLTASKLKAKKRKLS